MIDGRDVALGYDTAEEYLSNAGNMGATVGRYANRIRNGRFTLNGITYQLPCNRPPHCLHGGKVGFHHKLSLIHISAYADELEQDNVAAIRLLMQLEA